MKFSVPRAARFSLWTILIAIAIMIVSQAPVLWSWMTTKRVSVSAAFFDEEKSRIRGWSRVKRWDFRGLGVEVKHGETVVYYVDTGFKALEGYYRNNLAVRQTVWNLDGSVSEQLRNLGREVKTGPPWWWGVTDQTEPNDPEWIGEHNVKD